MPRRGANAILLGWFVLSLGWISQDRMLRDGDEEGHVGAAELFLGDLDAANWVGFFERLWVGPMGEYPQAFTAAVGFWWWLIGVGQPGHVAVRGICLLSLVIAAVSTGRIARRYVREESRGVAEAATLMAVLALPLCNGLARHFMPEGALIAAVSVSLLLAHRLVERPGLVRALLLGLSLGLGMLTKQTFLFLVLAPLVLVLIRMGRSGFAWLLLVGTTSCVVAVPWMLQNGADQVSYGLSSVLGHGDGGVWDHLEFYPLSLFVLGLGPVLSLGLIAAFWKLRNLHDRRALWLGTAWLLGGLAILILVPKKYPRLMAPLLPGAALCIGIAIAQMRFSMRWLWGLSGTALAWLALVSSMDLSLQPARPAIDPGCPQVWLRPPQSDDLGMRAVESALFDAPPGAVLVIGDPPIPCSIQTTHDWSSHLSPWLRRSGTERAVVLDADRAHGVVVDWLSGPGQAIDVPLLGATAYIRDSLEP